MMCCSKCQLNPDVNAGRPQNIVALKEKAFSLLKCKGQYCKAFQRTSMYLSPCGDCPQKYQLELCPQDIWVLIFLSSGDKFACDTACYTLDTLVTNGNAVLLTELFKAASYAIRKELWFRMVTYYRDRIYLLDEIFERDELPPATLSISSLQNSEYQHSILKNVTL